MRDPDAAAAAGFLYVLWLRETVDDVLPVLLPTLAPPLIVPPDDGRLTDPVLDGLPVVATRGPYHLSCPDPGLLFPGLLCPGLLWCGGGFQPW